MWPGPDPRRTGGQSEALFSPGNVVEEAPSDMTNLREVVRERLDALVRGELSPGDAADWAVEVMRSDDNELRDPVVWQAISELSRADLMTAPGKLLHGPSDFVGLVGEFDQPNSVRRDE